MLKQILEGMAPDPNWKPPLPRGDTNNSWLYPIMIGLGFVVAIFLTCFKLKKKYGLSFEPFYFFILIGVPIGIFGANFGSCFLGGDAGKNWNDFFSKFGQGLAIEWGVVFVAFAAFIYFPIILKRPEYKVRDEFGSNPIIREVSSLLYFDAITPCVLIAQFLGRWGNYFNQEVYGKTITNESFSWFLYRVLPGMCQDGEWKQPLFLWEGLGNLLVFFILYFIGEMIKQKKAGDLCASYFIWYGIFRMCLEPLRDSQFFSYKSIILSLLFTIFGISYLICNHIFYKKWRKIKMRIWFTNIFKSNKKNIYRSQDEMLYYSGF